MATGVAAAALAATTMTAFAATYSFSTTALPRPPFHLVVGDELTLSASPAVLPPPPPGMMYAGPATASLPGTSDPTILARISTSIDAAGVAQSTFQAIHAGTANVLLTSGTPCLVSIPSTSTLTVTTTITSSTTTTRTSTSTSTASGSGVCGAVATTWEVIVDASVQGASTAVPAAGAGSVPWSGVGVLFAGMAVVVAVLARRDTRNRP